MDTETMDLLETGELEVERAQKMLSKQPRFRDNGKDYDLMGSFYNSVLTWLKYSMDEIKEPEYIPDSRARDQWLSEFWKLEPHWAGVVNQAVLVDSSRPWTLTGGRNQVRLYATILHNSNDGKGWRHYFRQASQSYRITDMGSITEIGRDGSNGPLRALYHADSSRCKWTGKRSFPLLYDPVKGKDQRWKPQYILDVCSLPSTKEHFHNLGWCMTSRAFQLIKLLYGVLMHDQESVGVRMMRGLLLLQGVEQSQWEQAMQARDAEMTADELKYFGGVYVLASLGAGDIDAKLVGLSQLPANFDRETFINQVMFGYSLIAGYDPREFWPVSSGSLGTARETEQQHRKASTKGSLEFPHAWQEKLQQELPDTLLFEFEQRDTDAELIEAEMAQAWSEVARTLYDNGPQGQEGLLDQEKALSLLVDHGIIPAEWTAGIEEATVVSDEQYKSRGWQEKLRTRAEVQRALEVFQDEPIVTYRWNPANCQATEHVVWESGAAARRKEVFQVPPFLAKRDR